MHVHHSPMDIQAPGAVNDPVPLLDNEFDAYDPLQAYGEGFAEQWSASHTAPDVEGE